MEFAGAHPAGWSWRARARARWGGCGGGWRWGRRQAARVAGVPARDFMPDVSGLPGVMQEAEFKKRYGGNGAPADNKVMADLEARVGASAHFREERRGTGPFR